MADLPEALFHYPTADYESSLINEITSIVQKGRELSLEKDRCIIFTSRMPHKINSDDPRLRSIRNATGFAVNNNWLVISSTGGYGWDFITWSAARSDAEIWIILPPMKRSEFDSECRRTVERLNLNPENVTFVMPQIDLTLSNSEKQMLRDRFAFEISHHRLPVYVRKDGNWSKYQSKSRGYNETFLSGPASIYMENWRKDSSWQKNVPSEGWDNLLIHWTRGAYGPWPGEVEADYFEALTEAGSGNPRDGLATIRFIASTGILRGEGRMIKGGTPVISFTELSPFEAIKQIQYRSALGRWSFEPYGIALPKTTLQRMGARKVIYGDRELFKRLSDNERPFYQYQGECENSKEITDWRKENEWRLSGDLDLHSIREEVMILVPTKAEADRIRPGLSFKVCSLEGGIKEASRQ